MAIGVLTVSDPVTVNGESLESITFDCVKVETHESTARVTEHPIESGATVGDHIILDADRVTVEAVFSNGPLVTVGNNGPRYRIVQSGFGKALERVGTEGDVEPFRAETALDFVYQAQKARAVFNLTTSLRDYTNLALESIRTPRDAAMGDAVFATLVFKKIETVDSEEGELPPRESPARDTLNRGKKSKATANSDQTTKQRSVAARILF